MSEEEEDEISIKIPESFSLKEQFEEISTAYIARKDFLEKNISKGKITGPSKDLAMYSLARLKAVGQTMRALYEAERARRGAPALDLPPSNIPELREDCTASVVSEEPIAQPEEPTPFDKVAAIEKSVEPEKIETEDEWDF